MNTSNYVRFSAELYLVCCITQVITLQFFFKNVDYTERKYNAIEEWLQ